MAGSTPAPRIPLPKGNQGEQRGAAPESGVLLPYPPQADRVHMLLREPQGFTSKLSGPAAAPEGKPEYGWTVRSRQGQLELRI
jgi:hypothetical protein